VKNPLTSLVDRRPLAAVRAGFAALRGSGASKSRAAVIRRAAAGRGRVGSPTSALTATAAHNPSRSAGAGAAHPAADLTPPRSATLLTLALTALTLATLAGAAPAFAGYVHTTPPTQIGSEGTGDGQLTSPSEVAVDAASHDIYVADTGNDRIDQFGAAGNFIRAWGWGVADGTTEALQTCTSGCHPGLPGLGPGQFTTPDSIAVDNSGGPSEGDVYVGDSGTERVQKFTASGALVTGWGDSTPPNGQLAGELGASMGGVAVGPTGKLFAVNNSFGVFEFSEAGAPLSSFTFPYSVVPHGLAVDFAEDVYVVIAGPREILGEGNVVKFTSAGEEVGRVSDTITSGLAVDQGTNATFIGDEVENAVDEYPPACVPAGAESTCPSTAGFGAGDFTTLAGLGVDFASHAVYGVDRSTGTFEAFAAQLVPTATAAGATHLGATGATLNGSVDPEGLAVTSCAFEYVSEAAFESTGFEDLSSGGSAECEPGPTGVGSGSAPVAVTAEVSGLSPLTGYRFRISAENANGADRSLPLSFATPAAPSILSSSATAVTSDSADLNAEINPDRADTSFHFEYVSQARFEASGFSAATQTSVLDIGSSAEPQSVTRQIQGLEPATTYRFRVLATNSQGPALGADHTFTTQGEGGPLVLPDDRGPEMVSPLEKNNSLITAIDGLPGPTAGGVIQAAPEGQSFAYISTGAFADPLGGPPASQYLAERGPEGWSTTNLSFPLRSLSYPSDAAGGPYRSFSADLTKSLIVNGGLVAGGPIENPPLTPDAPVGYQNYYVRDALGTFTPILTEAPNESPSTFQLEFVGASPDLKWLAFVSTTALTPEAIDNGHFNLYDWSAAEGIRLVNVLPGAEEGTDSAQLGANNVGEPAGTHPISDDGSRIFFTQNGNLYLREDNARTLQLDRAQGGPESGGAVFQAAGADGSRVFFSDERKLTEDTDAVSFGGDLYEYDLETGRLTDLTAVDPEGGGFQGLLGASEDGSEVYFVANGRLATGTSRGDCSSGNADPSFECNLYRLHDGQVSYIATLTPRDNSGDAKALLSGVETAHDWNIALLERTARVTPDGSQLAFMSDSELTGYDNREFETGKPQQEVYVYDARRDELHCASCDPSGARPTGASWIPAGTQFTNTLAVYQSHLLSTGPDGNGTRVFFDSSDSLVPQDTDGTVDVYEWESEGTGSCRQTEGCVYLISGGTGASRSTSFLDASADGNDVFFVTAAQLVPADTDALADVYDARVGGGLPGPSAPSTPCNGEGCKAPAAPAPVESTPATQGPSVSGNVKPKHHKKKHKKHKPKKHYGKKQQAHKKPGTRAADKKHGGAK
jgi:hypothetical protein